MLEVFRKPEVVASIITAIVTMFVVWRTSKTTIEQTKSQRNIDAITKNRVEWIQTLKEYISEYTAIIQDFVFSNEPGTYNKVFKKISVTTNKIRLHLNLIGTKDQEILEKINCINNLISDIDEFGILSKERDYFRHICLAEVELLIIYIQIYLKTEWERVKFESENGNDHKFDFNKEFNKYKNKKIKEIKVLENKIEELKDKKEKNKGQLRV